MSQHEVLVVSVNLEPHPNADSLSVNKIGGWEVAVKTELWLGRTMGIYVQPDYVVPTDNPLFSFLKVEGRSFARVKVIKLRQRISQGILVPVPDDWENVRIGDNVMDRLGITRYEPPEAVGGEGQDASGPSGLYYSKYDVENINNWIDVIEEGEEVVVTEKIHGANGKFVFSSADDKFFAGSRTRWKDDCKPNLWHSAANQNPWIEETCRRNPDVIFFGEVFGNVQNLKYGSVPGQVMFRCFDALKNGEWLNWAEFKALFTDINNQIAPIVWVGPFNLELFKTLAEKDSAIIGANNMREGLVIKPVIERKICKGTKRVQFKLVSNRYLGTD